MSDTHLNRMLAARINDLAKALDVQTIMFNCHNSINDSIILDISNEKFEQYGIEVVKHAEAYAGDLIINNPNGKIVAAVTVSISYITQKLDPVALAAYNHEYQKRHIK